MRLTESSSVAFRRAIIENGARNVNFMIKYEVLTEFFLYVYARIAEVRAIFRIDRISRKVRKGLREGGVPYIRSSEGIELLDDEARYLKLLVGCVVWFR